MSEIKTSQISHDRELFCATPLFLTVSGTYICFEFNWQTRLVLELRESSYTSEMCTVLSTRLTTSFLSPERNHSDITQTHTHKRGKKSVLTAVQIAERMTYPPEIHC